MAEKVIVKNTSILALMGDITREKVDVIVNAANSGLLGGGGVDGAIHRAGGTVILEECRKIVSKIGRLPAGKAVITGAGKMQAKFVIHTVGPVWHGGNSNEANVLGSCYMESLKLAASTGVTSITFPAISTGIYGYPSNLAAEIAVGQVGKFIHSNDSSIGEVRFILYDSGSYNIYLKELDKLTGSA